VSALNLTTDVEGVKPDLATLADDINREHDKATQAAEKAIGHARRCGEHLIKAKAEIGHGGFLAWLKTNCRVKPRQAQIYMKVARNFDTITKSAPGAHLTIKGALRLAEPQEDTHSDELRQLQAESQRLFAIKLDSLSGDERWQHLKDLISLSDRGLKLCNRLAMRRIRYTRKAGRVVIELDRRVGDEHAVNNLLTDTEIPVAFIQECRMIASLDSRLLKRLLCKAQRRGTREIRYSQVVYVAREQQKALNTIAESLALH